MLQMTQNHMTLYTVYTIGYISNTIKLQGHHKAFDYQVIEEIQ